MWETGTVVIDGVTFLYEAKVYAIGSPNGIKDGRVSKIAGSKKHRREFLDLG